MGKLTSSKDATKLSNLGRWALWYLKQGLSVMPLKPGDKTPLLETWSPYKEKLPTPQEVVMWWKKWPNANIGVITGKLSGIYVVDADETKAFEWFSKFLPENHKIPTVFTPRHHCYHFWFKYPDVDGVVLTNTSGKIFPKLDTRGEGGFVVAPPSIWHENQQRWEWVEEFSRDKLIDLPPDFLKLLIDYHTGKGDFFIDAGDQKVTPHATCMATSSTQRQRATTFSLVNVLTKDYKIPEGYRDDSLFHIANGLAKGGFRADEIEALLIGLAMHFCDPPFPLKEAKVKVKSAMKRMQTRTRSWMQEIRELIATASDGIITTTDVYRWLQVTSRRDKKIVAQCLRRLADEGVLKRTGRRAGEYRIVSGSIRYVDWKNAKLEVLDLWLPLGIHEAVDVIPGSVIVIAGVQNAGKTAWAMNIAYHNQHRFKTVYFSSEITPQEFNERVRLYNGVENWTNVEFAEDFDMATVEDHFDPDGLNILDYLEPPNGDYTMMAKKLTDIHHALNKGIAVVCIQKKKGDFGAGGEYMKNKPHLYITLDVFYERQYSEARIVKCKKPKYGYKNPQGLKATYTINIRNGIEIIEITPFKFEKWLKDDDIEDDVPF